MTIFVADAFHENFNALEICENLRTASICKGLRGIT